MLYYLDITMMMKKLHKSLPYCKMPIWKPTVTPIMVHTLLVLTRIGALAPKVEPEQELTDSNKRKLSESPALAPNKRVKVEGEDNLEEMEEDEEFEDEDEEDAIDNTNDQQQPPTAQPSTSEVTPTPKEQEPSPVPSALETHEVTPTPTPAVPTPHTTEEKPVKLTEKGEKVGDDECGFCGETGDLLCCDGPCNRAFHFSCVGFASPPEAEKWYCLDCGKLVNDVRE